MRYLVSLAVGPVQDFIAAALRTRDLWFGSYMLSEVSKAAARSLHAQGARLVFPAAGEDPALLQPGSALNVANRVVAELDGDAEAARAAVDAAKKAAQERLDQFADEAKKAASVELREEQWNAQVRDLLELYACWVPLVGDYPAARARLDRLQAARKNTRDFTPAALGPEGPGFRLPKSSLDGRRETVLPEDLSEVDRRRLRLGRSEQLDAPGLIKRLAGGRAEQFTSVVRIALDPWLRRVAPDALDRLRDLYEPLVADDRATRVRGNAGCYADFPYDGDLLYPDRLEMALREADDPAERERLRALRKHLRPLWRRLGEPGSYYALLLADGDRMGALLDRAQSADQHRRISQALDEFARQVPACVRGWRGHCIYAGGDDVLALLPLDRALACADDLQRRFRKALAPVADALGSDTPPTLSAGLAFAHRLEPLGRVRGWAKEAEELAKKGFRGEAPRNALAVLVSPRSGAPVRWRRHWDADPPAVLARWAAAFVDGRLPDKLPYELRAMVRRLHGSTRFDELLEQELKLILSKKRSTGGAVPVAPGLVTALVAACEAQGAAGLERELLVARWLGLQGWSGEEAR